MALKLMKRSNSGHFYLRGSVRGLHVYESTKTSDGGAAETIRILRERELLDESIFGKKINATFEQAAKAYIDGGGSERFLSRLVDALGSKLLRKIKQNDLDSVARKLYPAAAPETLNRQCYTPFIAYERAALFVSHLSPAPAMIMTALFYTGMRPIELFCLDAANVDVASRWIVLTHTKTGEPRGVPMHEFLVPLFTALARRGGILFQTHRGRPYQLFKDRGGQLKNAIQGARDRLANANAPINDISPYTARHTVSTQLVINGVHHHIKDQILGHAVDDMSRHYTRVPQAPLIEAINTLPVPLVWRDMWWWSDPAGTTRTHIRWGRK